VISIIDDDKSVREATKSLLKAYGYGAVTFASAEDFLRSDQIDHTSCLITDVQMPGLSGVELQTQLIAEGHRMPVIFMTASKGEGTRAGALKAGAIAFLTKPFAADRLIAHVNAALADRRLEAAEPPAQSSASAHADE
jgi:FixJ family two-component response regulator